MKALGMESGAIADSQITASSEWDVYSSPKRARLYTRDWNSRGLGLGAGAWISLTNDMSPWIQVDLGKTTPVTHVATQGRNKFSPGQWVTKYKLQFSDDGVSFLFYKGQGESSDAVNIEILYKQRIQPALDPKICSDIRPRTLYVPRSKQFSEEQIIPN